MLLASIRSALSEKRLSGVISRDLIYATRHSVVVVHVTPSAMLDVPIYFRTFRTVIVILQST